MCGSGYVAEDDGESPRLTGNFTSLAEGMITNASLNMVFIAVSEYWSGAPETDKDDENVSVIAICEDPLIDKETFEYTLIEEGESVVCVRSTVDTISKGRISENIDDERAVLNG